MIRCDPSNFLDKYITLGLDTHDSIEAVMITEERLESADLHPSSAHLCGCIAKKATNISSDLVKKIPNRCKHTFVNK